MRGQKEYKFLIIDCSIIILYVIMWHNILCKYKKVVNNKDEK